MVSVVSVTPRPQYFRDPLNRRLGWTQTWSGCSGEDRTSCPDQKSHYASSDVQPVPESLYRLRCTSFTAFTKWYKKSQGSFENWISVRPLGKKFWRHLLICACYSQRLGPVFFKYRTMIKCKSRLLLKIIRAFNINWTPRTTFYQHSLTTFGDKIRSTYPTFSFCVHFIHFFQRVHRKGSLPLV